MGKTYKIIIAEDDVSHKELIFRAFEEYTEIQYKLIWSDCLNEARKQINDHKPDIVISDVRLTDGDGVELVDVVKNICPIILITSFGNEELAVKSLKAGVSDYIVKSPDAFKKIPLVATRVIREWEKEITLKETEERYRLAVQGSYDTIWDWDIENDSFFLSKDITRIYESDSEKISLNTFFEILHKDDVEKAKSDIENYLKGQDCQYEAEYRIRMQNGDIKWILVRGKGLRNLGKGNIKRIAGSITDISDRKNYEKRIEELAFYDSVSGLPNRILFIDKFSRLFDNKSTQEQAVGCVLFLKVNNFKFISDLMGYDFGERLLRRIACILKGKLDEDIIVARMYGAEFSMVIKNLEDRNEIEKKANEIISVFKNKISIDEQSMYLTVNLGISVFPKDGLCPEDALNNAKLAMYASRKNGNFKYEFFEKELKNEIQSRLDLEQLLRGAVANNEFILYYQPQLDLSDNSLYGFEALIRWISKDNGIIPPNVFIPIAEETGLIIPIGNFVLSEACKYAKKIYDLGKKDIYVSVNISAVQLIQYDFVETVINNINATGIPANMLGLEITESFTIDYLNESVEKLNHLRKLGIRVFLDDFGTGYSSLNYIDKLPIDVVKIDKSFVDDVIFYGRRRSLTESIMNLINSLGMKVLAEGVETSEQMEELKKMKCDIIQGYYISKPVPEIEASKFISLYK